MSNETSVFPVALLQNAVTRPIAYQGAAGIFGVHINTVGTSIDLRGTHLHEFDKRRFEVGFFSNKHFQTNHGHVGRWGCLLSIKPCFHGGFLSFWRVIVRSLSDLDLLSIRIAMKYRTSAGFEAGCRREGVLHELEVNDLAIMNTGKD